MELPTELVARWTEQTLKAEITPAEMLVESRRELTKGAAWKLEVSPKALIPEAAMKSGEHLKKLTLKVGRRLSVTKQIVMAPPNSRACQAAVSHHRSDRHRSRWPREQYHLDSGRWRALTSCQEC
jgi:hypothetical protein